MSAFLVLTSLSVVFYLAMLIALYRDKRRRTFNPESAYTIKLGVVARLGRSPAVNQLHNAPETPIWMTAVRAADRPKAYAGTQNSSKLVFLPAPAHDKDDMLCS
jgi:hypothetical protein